MNESAKLPFYAKASLLTIGAYFFISILSITQDIFLPILYATILAISISPLVNFFVKKNFNRALSIALVLLIIVLVVALIVSLIATQASNLSDALPQLTNKFQLLLNQGVAWSSAYFNISTIKIDAWIEEAKLELLGHSRQAIGSTLSTMGFLLQATTLTLVYICMILYYQTHLTAFVHQIFSANHNSKVGDLLNKTKAIIQGYLVGLFTEFAIVAVLNSIGLLLLGIDYAIVLGVLGALLNIIPYVGGLVGVAIFMVVALVTKAPIYVLYIFVLYSFIQFVDNNYIVPKIIGSKVKLNALVCVIAVIAGGALWGLPGMFLSIPLTAIIKLICDNIDSLKPWGFLLGDENGMDTKTKSSFTIKGFVRNLISKK